MSKVTEAPGIAADASDIALAPRLGVGLLFNPALPEFVAAEPDSFDYLEIIPDRDWVDRGVGASPRYTVLEKSWDWLRRIRERKPFVCHSVGLSIGSAALFDTEHLRQIQWTHGELDFAWHSDHLSFARLPQAGPQSGPQSGKELHAAIALPLPCDESVLQMLVERIGIVRELVPLPFLVENNVYYVQVPEQDMSEPEFLNRLARDSGCGILLDIHNVYANARNHGFAPEHFLRDLDLSRVVELHIAGGDELLGFYTDAHAGPVAEPVWSLLEQTLRAAPWIRAITFEFHESYYPLLRADGIRRQLQRARQQWERFC